MAARVKPGVPKKKPTRSKPEAPSELKVGKTYRSSTGGTVKVTAASKRLKGH
jgi:hypothetical protein